MSSTSNLDKFAHNPFWEIERNGPLLNRIKTLVIDHKCGKPAVMQCLVCCGRTEDNYDMPILSKCCLGYGHSETYVGCSGLKQLLLEEKDGGYPLAIKARIARSVLKKGTHEAKFVEWLELQKCLGRDVWRWSRPTLDQLRIWYPSPQSAVSVAAVVPAPQAMPVAMSSIVNLPPPSSGAGLAAGVQLPSLAEVLGGGSSLPPPPAFDAPDEDMGLGGGDYDDEPPVDPSQSAAQRPWVQIKEEMTHEQMCANNYHECFSLLGLASTASPQEIKKAYFIQVVRVHPDKVTEEADKAEAEARFKLLHMAYTIAHEMRERADCGRAPYHQRRMVDVALLTFEQLPQGAEERPFRVGGALELTNADYSTGAAMPAVYMGETLSDRTRTCYIALAQILHPVVKDELLHELGWHYYHDGKKGYLTKYEAQGQQVPPGNWIIDVCDFFCSAVCNPQRALGRVGKTLSAEELEAFCPVDDSTNWIYALLKFFLSRMDPDNSWAFSDPSEVSNEDWCKAIEAEPVFKALCWLIGHARENIMPDGNQLEHPLMKYLDAFCDPEATPQAVADMTFLRGGGWTTRNVQGKEGSAPARAIKKEIADYWATQRDHIFYALPESGMDTYFMRLSDLSDAVTADPEQLVDAKGRAYSDALKDQEPLAKRRRLSALTPSTGGASSSTAAEGPLLIGDGSADDPMILSSDSEDED